MRLISNAAVPRVIDALAVTLAQATQLARTRLASAGTLRIVHGAPEPIQPVQSDFFLLNWEARRAHCRASN